MHANTKYKVDYLRIKFTIDADLFESIYARIKILMLKKWGGSVEDMERCHKVNVFRNYSTKANYYMIDIWDEGSEVFYDLAEQYGSSFQRVDIRHIEPNSTQESVIALGHQLQVGVTSWNVNTYKTKPASKRMGRDRGGIGFAIGSHKSDLRIAKYIRGREQGAIEYQFQGRLLRKALEAAREEKAATLSPLGVGDFWANNLDAMGHDRYSAACNQAHKAATEQLERKREDRLRNLSQSPLWESDTHRSVSASSTETSASKPAEESQTPTENA